MYKVIGYLAFVFRHAFLPLREHIIKTKRKVVILLASNIIMMYAVFIISIPPKKSIFTKVNEAYRTAQATIDMQERKIHEIMLKHAALLLHSNMITIVPSATLEAER